MLQPLGQPRDLDMEDLLAALAQLFLAARHERMGLDRAPQLRRRFRLLHSQLEALHPEAGPRSEEQRMPGLAEAIGAQPIDLEPVEIDIDDPQDILSLEPRRVIEDGAVLGDQAMAAEDDIRRRFMDAARS